MENRFIRVVSPFSFFLTLVADVAAVFLAKLAIDRLKQVVDAYSIIFIIVIVFTLILVAGLSVQLFKNGVKFDDEKMEFTSLDDNNVFYYKDIEKIETIRDTKASLKKNFVDRYSRIVIHTTGDDVVTIDLGLTTKGTLTKIEQEIRKRTN